jgi:hypothetical protein
MEGYWLHVKVTGSAGERSFRNASRHFVHRQNWWLKSPYFQNLSNLPSLPANSLCGLRFAAGIR